MVISKFANESYDWWGCKEQGLLLGDKHNVDFPELQGIKMSAETAKIYQSVYDLKPI